MTDEEVKNGFDEVYNKFWLKYRDKSLMDSDKEEGERINTWAIVLIKKYPFLRETIAEMVLELGRRAKERDRQKKKAVKKGTEV